MQTIDRIATISALILLSISSIEMAAKAQPAPEVAIDRAFRYESSAPNLQSQQMLGSLKNWLGAYQRFRKDGNGYVVVFDRGSLPVDAKFKANDSIKYNLYFPKRFGTRCPGNIKTRSHDLAYLGKHNWK